MGNSTSSGAESRSAPTEYTRISDWPSAPPEFVELVGASTWDDAAVRAHIEAVSLGELDVTGGAEEPILFAIVRRGSLETVEAALRSTVTVSMKYTSDSGASAVSIAVWRNDPAVLRAVVAKHGA